MYPYTYVDKLIWSGFDVEQVGNVEVCLTLGIAFLVPALRQRVQIWLEVTVAAFRHRIFKVEGDATSGRPFASGAIEVEIVEVNVGASRFARLDRLWRKCASWAAGPFNDRECCENTAKANSRVVPVDWIVFESIHLGWLEERWFILTISRSNGPMEMSLCPDKAAKHDDGRSGETHNGRSTDVMMWAVGRWRD